MLSSHVYASQRVPSLVERVSETKLDTLRELIITLRPP
jgi:hypothetical protein